MIKFALLIAVCLVHRVTSHGYMSDPPNRASMWRYGFPTPVNYDDNAYFCGGFQVQYEVNGGQCGECGDDYRLTRPRSNENFGTYGRTILSRRYRAGQVIPVSVRLTANHWGWFRFSLCQLTRDRVMETNECFEQNVLQLADGSGTLWHVPNPDPGVFHINVKLPSGFMCKRCVLQWHYNAGTSWGVCANGTSGNGCGNQETFRSCADIAILP